MAQYLSLWRGLVRGGPTMAHIMADVCALWGDEESVVRGRSKAGHLTFPRGDFCRRAHAAGFSNAQIGRFLGNRDHSTVNHYRDRWEELAA